MRKTKKSLSAKATAFLAIALPAVAIAGPSLASASPTLSRVGATNVSIDSLQKQFGAELLLVGPLSSVNSTGTSFDVLGQTVTLGPKAVANAVLRPGQLIAVTGAIQPDGKIVATGVVDLQEEYVDGATEVMGSGVVTAHTPTLAKVTVGRLAVDYSPALHAGDPGLAVGSTVQFRGIQIGSTSSAIAFSIAVANRSTGSMGSGQTVTAQATGSMGSGHTVTTQATGSMGSGHTATAHATGSMGSGHTVTAQVTGSMGSGHTVAAQTTGSMGSGR